MERKCLKNYSTWKTHKNCPCVVLEQSNELNKTCPDAEAEKTSVIHITVVLLAWETKANLSSYQQECEFD